MKSLLWDWYVKNPLCTDRCRHRPVYHNNGLWQLEINRCPQFWQRNQSQWNRLRSDKLPRPLYTGLYLNCHELFYLEDFIGGIGTVLSCSSLTFVVLQTIFWNHASWSQKGKSRSLHLCFTLSLWKLQNQICSDSSNCVNSTCCSLSFRFIGRTSVLEYLQPFFLVTMRPMVCVGCWTCGFYQIFASLVSLKTKMGNSRFLAFLP